MKGLIVFIICLFQAGVTCSQEHQVTVKKGTTTLDIYSASQGSALKIEKVNAAGLAPALMIDNQSDGEALVASSASQGVVARFTALGGGVAISSISTGGNVNTSNLGGEFLASGTNSNGVLGIVTGSGTTNIFSGQGYGGYFSSSIAQGGGVYGVGFNGVYGQSSNAGGSGGYFRGLGSSAQAVYAIGSSKGLVAEGPVAAEFRGNVNMTESLQLQGALNVGGSIDASSDITTSKKLTCRDATISRDLILGEDAEIQGDMEVDGDLITNGRFVCSDIAFISKNVGIGTNATGRELQVSDTDGDNDAVAEFSAGAKKFIIGVNPSSEGILGTISSHALNIRTNNTNRMVVTKDGNIGFGRSTADHRVDVSGNIRYSGNLIKTSDKRYKKNIQTIESALGKVLDLRGVSYYLRQDEFPEMKFADSRQIGFVAQEIETKLPELVVTDDQGFKAVDYASMTAVLVQAMNEQQIIIDELISENNKLAEDLGKLDARLAKLEKERL